MNQNRAAIEGDLLVVEQLSPQAAEPRAVARAPLFAAGLALAAMFSIQFGAALSAPVMDLYGASSTTWLRLCLAAMVLALVVRPPLQRYGRQQWLIALALGAAMACMTLCFFAALERIPLGLAVAIEFLGPLGVAVLGARSAVQLIWPLLAGGGVLLLARQGGGWNADGLGLLLAVAAALGWASYILLMKKAGAQFKGLQGLSVSLLVAAVLATPLGLSAGGAALSLQQLYLTLGLALLVPLLPYVLELTALRRMSTAAFGILMSAEPAIGALAGFVVLQQSLSLLQCLGTLCVVLASVGALLHGARLGEPSK